MELVSGGKTSITLTLQGESDRNLTVIPTEAETLTARSESVLLKVSETQTHPFQGQEFIELTVSTSAATVSARYELLVSVSDGLVCQGVYLSLTVSK